jgi:hypothetical protein
MRQTLLSTMSAVFLVSIGSLVASPANAVVNGPSLGAALDAVSHVEKHVEKANVCWRWGWHGWGWYPCFYSYYGPGYAYRHYGYGPRFYYRPHWGWRRWWR